MKIDISQLEFIEPILREMALLVEEAFGFEPTITSLYRIGDTGVHGQLPLRGIDLSCHDDDLGNHVADYLNKRYEYDPMRPDKTVCKYHDAGSGYHLHIQCHPNTQLRPTI